tara:strand:- start:1265 stop:1660 length:396 start_codon:yes stop_codon:yes gene_type:complete
MSDINNYENTITQKEGDNKKEQEIEVTEFVIAFSIFIIGFFITLLFKNNSKQEIKFLTNKVFIVSFFIIMFICYYIFFKLELNSETNIKLYNATKHALLAYILAVFIRLDSILISPFIIIFAVSYFLHIDG